MQNINGEISTRRGISGTVSSTTLHAQIDVEDRTDPSTQGESEIHGTVNTEQQISGGLKGSRKLNGELDRNYRGGGGGNDDYNPLRNKPSINGVTLKGDKTFEELGREDIRNVRIKEIIDTQYELIFGGNN